MKLSVIYFSETGNTQRVAEWIAAGAESAGKVEVKCLNLNNPEMFDAAFVNASAAVIFGTPTYYANLCWQMKKWIDTDTSCRLAGKIGAVFATENSPHGGGAELANMTLINHLLVKGMLIYSGGAACGRPFIHVGPTIVRSQMGEREEVCRIFGRRIAEKAKELF